MIYLAIITTNNSLEQKHINESKTNTAGDMLETIDRWLVTYCVSGGVEAAALKGSGLKLLFLAHAR